MKTYVLSISHNDYVFLYSRDIGALLVSHIVQIAKNKYYKSKYNINKLGKARRSEAKQILIKI